MASGGDDYYEDVNATGDNFDPDNDDDNSSALNPWWVYSTLLILTLFNQLNMKFHWTELSVLKSSPHSCESCLCL